MLVDEPISLVVSVKDATEESVNVEIVGRQQVVATRNFRPPVVVRYVTPPAAVDYDTKVVAEIRKLLRRT